MTILSSSTASRRQTLPITGPKYHLITSLENREVELYDYHADPLEQNPLSGPEYQEVTKTLLGQLVDWSEEQIASRRLGGTETLVLDKKVLDETALAGLHPATPLPPARYIFGSKKLSVVKVCCVAQLERNRSSELLISAISRSP
jgi:hypothetical protein